MDTLTCVCGSVLRVPTLTELARVGRCTECGYIFDLVRLPDGTVSWQERPAADYLPLLLPEEPERS